MTKRRIAALLTAAIILALLMMASAYLSAGYDAGEEALDAMAQGATQGRVTAFGDAQSESGLIFYPGGLVDHAAYALLMREIAERGVFCLLVEMPLDLAVLDMNAADGLTQAYPQIKSWVIGGHSLGGAMAASHAAKHPEDFAGLLLLGAYAAADLSRTGLSVLSLYGSEDGVMNREKYEESRALYPAEFCEIMIPGGNHAGFGCYGAQKGDGTAAISQAEQWAVTADAVEQWIGR